MAEMRKALADFKKNLNDLKTSLFWLILAITFLTVLLAAEIIILYFQRR